ncbi:MAG: lysine--tRNA ligase [Candidatus Babeliaceae bacterium]|nr:lysine--tRNA ligase [Candidatus Babeliaceae bacterium]
MDSSRKQEKTVENSNADSKHQSVRSEYENRIKKAHELEAIGDKPWAEMHQVPNSCEQILEEFTVGAEKTYTTAGRILTKRMQGKAGFVTIQDRTGRLQLYIREDAIGVESFKKFIDFIDMGDIIWATGYSFKTKTGEISLHISSWQLLTKNLHPLPEKFHGIHDIETKYRQRYLDLMTSPETRERFVKRTAIIKEIRYYLDKNDFLEVETPMLHPIPGGAAARPFITHHNALDTDFYLRIAPELYLKRLVVGGFERVYEINRNFRNEGVSTRHNPEFTMVEFYMAHEDYQFAMSFVEKLIREMARKVSGHEQVIFGDYTLDFSKPFDRMNAQQAIIKYSSVTQQELEEKNIDTTLEKYKVKLENKAASYGQKVFALFEEVAESKLINPTYIIDFPIETSPLAKRDAKNPTIAARFELFIAGMEISNGFNELNDPFDQAERFKEQVKAHEAGDAEAMHYDADYITALEYGLPPTVGCGIGVDRLVMLLTNTTSIKEVILFPALKRK